jgi:N-acetylglucosamine-6-phosphate deacetylase
MTTRHAVAADYVFDGHNVHRDAAVMIGGARITAVLPRNEVPQSTSVQNLPDGCWLAPGFIDIQVNGGGDVLFNEQPTLAGIHAIAAAHRRFGTTSLLPTLISDSVGKMGMRWRPWNPLWPRIPAYSASTSKGRSSRRKSPACMTRAISENPPSRTTRSFWRRVPASRS